MVRIEEVSDGYATVRRVDGERRMKTHSLEDLFSAAGINLASNEDELNLARKLSDAVPSKESV